ncbi:MAG: diaminopimelate epimerase [Acidimicrobiia bacterium]|nr:diaminopimelate epimerase [Acidimicrobiia bacterium]
MDFVKMHGLGNDFVVLRGPFEPTAAQVAAWCDRRRGIGADGVLVVSALEDGLIGMEYWNADGSPAEMCGNGLRCVARYAVDAGMADGPEFVVQTAVGRRPVSVREDGTVRALLGTVTAADAGPLDVAGYHLDPIRVGNPHAVAFVADCYSTPVDAVGPIVEGDPHFPERTNVEFATVVSSNRIALRVWERGVGETLACGTGAAATAAVANAKGLTDAVVTVELPGGTLIVEVAEDGVWIDGPTEAVFSGSV